MWGLPVKKIKEIIRSVRPDEGYKVSEEANEFVERCAYEFVMFLTSEAVEEAFREERSGSQIPKVTEAGVLRALHRLGFDNHSMTAALGRYQEVITQAALESKKAATTRSDPL